MPVNPSLQAEIEECERTHGRLLAAIAGLRDDEVRQPSLLPGWTRGHILSHLVSQADSIVRRLLAAGEGRIIDQYVGGAQGRREEIEAGAQRPPTELLAVVRRSALEVDEIFRSSPEEVWERPIRAVDGSESPAAQAVFTRWREVEAHHVDLDVGYQVRDWPATLVARWLPGTLEGLPRRADGHELLGWLLGRAPAPDLGPWG